MTTTIANPPSDAMLRAMMPGTPTDTARTLRAYHNDPAIKRALLRQVRMHEKADEIVHGVYWENGKGCAVGCMIHSGDHALFEPKFGIPRVLPRLLD